MSSSCRVEYTVITSAVTCGRRTLATYGIRAVCADHGVTEIRDVSLSLRETAGLCLELNRADACCCHLLNICEDFAGR